MHEELYTDAKSLILTNKHILTAEEDWYDSPTTQLILTTTTANITTTTINNSSNNHNNNNSDNINNNNSINIDTQLLQQQQQQHQQQLHTLYATSLEQNATNSTVFKHQGQQQQEILLQYHYRNVHPYIYRNTIKTFSLKLWAATIPVKLIDMNIMTVSKNL
ncbi:hypothetical protein CVS40_10106 [Lucilia cuprina]|nr:hypothetical protein CVS40_10106 [Lucilia cuprina]